MNCSEVMELRHACVDGELDLVRSLEIETHLKTCANCANSFQAVKALRAAIRPESLYHQPPAAMRRRITSALREADEVRPVRPARPRFGQLWQFGLAGGVAVLIAFLLLPIIRHTPDTQLAQEVASSHIRSLMPGHITDIASSNQHNVKPWFDGKLTFSPPVLDLTEHGFPLLGGRLDYLENQPVAALVYQRQQHLINLFVWPAAGEVNPNLSTVNGYHIIHWTNGGMTYWAVSDLNTGELNDFVQLIQSQPSKNSKP